MSLLLGAHAQGLLSFSRSTYVCICGVKRLVETGNDGLYDRHEDLLQKWRDLLLVFGHQLVDERDELLDVMGLYQEENIIILRIFTVHVLLIEEGVRVNTLCNP